MSRAAGLAAVAASLAIAGRDAHAADARAAADALTINVVGACPDAAAVRRLLAELLSDGDAARTEPVTVQDRGPRYRVAVGEAAAMVDDPARDCAVARAPGGGVRGGTAARPEAGPGPAEVDGRKGHRVRRGLPEVRRALGAGRRDSRRARQQPVVAGRRRGRARTGDAVPRTRRQGGGAALPRGRGRAPHQLPMAAAPVDGASAAR